MKNKKAQNEIISVVLIILLVIAAIVIVWQVVKNAINEEALENTVTQEPINLSEYDNMTILHKALDIDGNEVTGVTYYGVNGIYSLKEPVYIGTNRYSFWIYNESYFVEPAEFKEIDETTKNQTVVLKAYKKQDITDSIGMTGDSVTGDIVFRNEDLDDVAYFKLLYYSTKASRFPFGALVIFEYDARIQDVSCGSSYYTDNAYQTTYPRYYTFDLATNRATAFEIPKDDGDFSNMEFYCSIIKYNESILISNNIKTTIVPKDFYLEKIDYTETYELKLGYEDKYINAVSKPIYIRVEEIQ